MAGGRQGRGPGGRIDEAGIRAVNRRAQGAGNRESEVGAVEKDARIKETRRTGDVHRSRIGDVDRATSRAGPERSEGESARNGGDSTTAGSSRQRADGLGVSSSGIAKDSSRGLRQRVRTEDDRTGVRQEVDVARLGQFKRAAGDSGRASEKIARSRSQHPCARSDLPEAGGVRGYGRGDRVVRGAGSSQDERFGAGDPRDGSADRQGTGTAGVEEGVCRSGVDRDRPVQGGGRTRISERARGSGSVADQDAGGIGEAADIGEGQGAGADVGRSGVGSRRAGIDQGARAALGEDMGRRRGREHAAVDDGLRVTADRERHDVRVVMIEGVTVDRDRAAGAVSQRVSTIIPCSQSGGAAGHAITIPTGKGNGGAGATRLSQQGAEGDGLIDQGPADAQWAGDVAVDKNDRPRSIVPDADIACGETSWCVGADFQPAVHQVDGVDGTADSQRAIGLHAYGAGIHADGLREGIIDVLQPEGAADEIAGLVETIGRILGPADHAGNDEVSVSVKIREPAGADIHRTADGRRSMRRPETRLTDTMTRRKSPCQSVVADADQRTGIIVHTGTTARDGDLAAQVDSTGGTGSTSHTLKDERTARVTRRSTGRPARDGDG